MTDEDRGYSVLLVSAPGKTEEALVSLLPEERYRPLRTVSDVSAAKRAAAEREFDLVLINSPLPDDSGVRYAVDSSSGGCVVLFLVRAELYAETEERLGRCGVFVLSKPASKSAVSTALSWMRSARERLRKAEKKSLTLEEKMEEIRLVNRAKWILIRTRGMDEAEAHRFIEKQAMDRCVTRREVADGIIRGDRTGYAGQSEERTI